MLALGAHNSKDYLQNVQIAPDVSPTNFSSLHVHVKIDVKMFEGCVCSTVRGAFLVSKIGGELRNCGTDQNPPFFCDISCEFFVVQFCVD